MTNLKYNKLAMQSYLFSNMITKYEGQNLFKFRTRMALFAVNFKNGTNNLECPLCEEPNSLDSELHNLKCDKMIQLLPEVVDKDIKHIYSDNVKAMKKIIIVLTKMMDIRSDLKDKIIMSLDVAQV